MRRGLGCEELRSPFPDHIASFFFTSPHRLLAEVTSITREGPCKIQTLRFHPFIYSSIHSYMHLLSVMLE